MDDKFATITIEEYNYLKLRDAQLEFALDCIPNLDDVLEQFEYTDEVDPAGDADDLMYENLDQNN